MLRGEKIPIPLPLQSNPLITYLVESKIKLIIFVDLNIVTLYSFVVGDVSCFYRRTQPLRTSIIRHFLSTYANLWPSKEMKENHKGTWNKLSKNIYQYNFLALTSYFSFNCEISSIFLVAVQSMTSQGGSYHTHAGNTIILWHETCGYRTDDSLERVSCLYFLPYTTELTICGEHIILDKAGSAKVLKDMFEIYVVQK